MPQLDTANFFNQIFWLVLTFGACYFLVHFSIVPNVKFCLSIRKKRIDDLMYEAQQTNVMLENVEQQIEAVNAYANSQAENMVKKAHLSSAKMLSECISKANQEFISYAKEIDVSKKHALAQASEILPKIIKDVADAIENGWVYNHPKQNRIKNLARNKE